MTGGFQVHHISPGKYKPFWLVSMCSIISKHTYFLFKVDLHCNLPHFRNVSNTSGTFCESFYINVHIYFCDFFGAIFFTLGKNVAHLVYIVCAPFVMSFFCILLVFFLCT